MKILLNISVPAVGASYDILVPRFLRIRTVISLISGAVEKLSDHTYVSSGEEHLCSAEKNIVLRSNSTLEQYGIKNGDHLVMM